MKVSHEYINDKALHQFEIHDDGVLVLRTDETGQQYKYKFTWGMQFVTNRGKPIQIIRLKRDQKSFVKGFYPFARYIKEDGSLYGNTDCSLANQLEILIAKGVVTVSDEQYDTNELETSTDKQSLIKARRGQAQFRSDLINYWGGCAATGNTHRELLIASHIKPWANSSSKERLDPFNGILLIANMDKAFDSGLISFDDNGAILISHVFDDIQSAGVSNEVRIKVTDKHKPYLAYHRKNVFKDKEKQQ
ncbi:HNH endonuclease [Photobacterium damselae subsp. damselae]|uniref:HNH endonuclease n=1 Tax=Photobacterium damselae subsp. damselae TaxID=85581 RepID=A0A850QTZ7_PHODD|nr:HNH endonuclease [Photobacterium damselae subsp. damselae]